LFVGANLTELDDWTAQLLTNSDVVRIDQASAGSRQVDRDGNVIAWTSDLKDGSHALAFFNTGDAPATVMKKPFAMYGLTKYKSYRVRDAWAGRDMGNVEDAVSNVVVPPHGCVLWVLRKPGM
jgi:hypothetical protein